MTASPLLLPDAASHAPAAFCLADAHSISVAIEHGDGLSILVAEDVGPRAENLAEVFTAGVRFGIPLGVMAARLDDVVSNWQIPSVMATLLHVSEHSFTLLHRGGPTPILVHESRLLTRVMTELPGPPLGPHDVPGAAVATDQHRASAGDVPGRHDAERRGRGDQGTGDVGRSHVGRRALRAHARWRGTDRGGVRPGRASPGSSG